MRSRTVIRSLGRLAFVIILALSLAACTGGPAIASAGILTYDRDMLERSGVVLVENGGDADMSGVQASFVLKPQYDVLPVLSGCVESTGDGKAVVNIGDVPAGGSVELDISGMIHAYIDLGAGYEIMCGGSPVQPEG